jgi:predicted nucleic acid-binding Zn ribbon protein
MPTYEFRCPDGTIVERFFKMSEVPDTIPAPDGSGDAVRVISGGAGLLFKGEGFYITDYGKDGKKDQRAAAAPAKDSSGGGGSEGTPKPAAATESAPSAPKGSGDTKAA